MDLESFKIKATSAFETSGTTHPAMQRHIPEDTNARFCILFTCGLFNPYPTNVENRVSS